MFKSKRSLLILPLLSALFWGSCYDPSPNGYRLPQTERDGRAAVCSFCASLFAIVVASHLRENA